MTMPDGVPQGPWHPRTQPAQIGLDFDRADVEPAQVVHTGGGFPVGARNPIAVRVKACCPLLVGEVCDCAQIRRQVRTAPVIVLRAYNLPALRAAGVTAAELHRREVA